MNAVIWLMNGKQTIQKHVILRWTLQFKSEYARTDIKGLMTFLLNECGPVWCGENWRGITVVVILS